MTSRIGTLKEAIQDLLIEETDVTSASFVFEDEHFEVPPTGFIIREAFIADDGQNATDEDNWSRVTIELDFMQSLAEGDQTSDIAFQAKDVIFNRRSELPMALQRASIQNLAYASAKGKSLLLFFVNFNL
jgi:hypothetical protein